MEFTHQLTGFDLECKITSYLNICVIYMLSVFYLCTYMNNIYMYTHIYILLDCKYPESIFTYGLQVWLS